ncbi:MAG: ABC transporter substrate-binding protein [Anaerolineae bacterium]|jgi:multiple sugar transport system substrate-binding protein|nr:ABC transporter substrate-binding protein [Chloroflexota bacterium]
MSELLTRRNFLKYSALAAGAVLAACTPSAPTGGTEGGGEATAPTAASGGGASAPAAGAKEKILYWDNSSPEGLDGQVKEAMIQNYRDNNPDKELESVYKPTTAGTQMSEALLTSIAAGNPPDAAYFDRFIVAAWAAEGSLTDLTDLCASNGITSDQYFPFAWTEVTGWQDKVWALPFDTDTRAVYFDKAVISEGGFDPENMPTTLEELDAMAEKLFKTEDGRMTRAGFIPWYGQGGCPYLWEWTWGHKFWDKSDPSNIVVNSDICVASMEWRRQYAEKYDIQAYESFSSAFGTEALSPFYVGQLGMWVDGDWRIAGFKKYAPDVDYGIITTPFPAGGRTATMAGGWSVVVPAGAKNVAGGFDFISTFGGPGEFGMNYYCRETAHIPTLKTLAEDPVYTEDPKHKVFMDLLPIADTRPPVPIGQFLWTALGEARDLVIHGTKTAKEALDDVQANAAKEMERFM